MPDRTMAETLDAVGDGLLDEFAEIVSRARPLHGLPAGRFDRVGRSRSIRLHLLPYAC